MSHFLYLRKKYWTMEGISCILNSGHFGEVPKLAELKHFTSRQNYKNIVIGDNVAGIIYRDRVEIISL